MINSVITLPQNGKLAKPQACETGVNTLVQIFFSSTDEVWLAQLLKDVSTYYPKAVVIGSSTDEAISADKVCGSCAVITISRFEQTTLSAAMLKSNGNSFETGHTIGKKICRKNTKAVIVFADAGSINGEEFLSGISKTTNNAIVAGGLASTPSFTNTFVIFQNKIIKNGVVAVALNSNVLVAKAYHAFGWRAIGQEMLVTKADKHKVDAIDGKTPLSIFRKYLGKGVANSFPGMAFAFPLILRRGESLVARGILRLEGESFVVSGNVNVGDKVYIGYGNPAQVVEQNEIVKNIADTLGKPEAVFSYYCMGRKMFLPRKTVEFEAKSNARAGNISGFFTLGEFFTGEMPNHLNFSSTVIALREGEKEELKYKKITPPKPDFVNLVSDGLFNFIDTRTKELDFLAYHDVLTSLANRALLTDRTEHALSHAKRYGFRAAMLFVDIDRFKIINDTLGHEVGDGVLMAISRKIEKTLRSDDTLARLGGDEFVILLENVEGEQHAAQIAARVIDAASKPIGIAGKKLSVTASVGIAIFPEDGENYQELIKNADAAMYQAKTDGRNGYAFYRKELTEEASRILELQNELKTAIQKEQFTLFYQPQIDLKTKKLIGAEALIRWNHPKRGLITPCSFLPEAADFGLMPQIGEFVVEKACEQLKQWLAKGFKIPKVSVNITAEEFYKNDLAKRLYGALNTRNLESSLLQIEITETGIMQDGGVAIDELRKINDMGISVSIDDFGTGYSSLSYLKKLPVKEIKIDRSFVSDIISDSGNKAIVRAILAISKELGLEVVAEGIEHKNQATFLMTEGCRYGQGYLYSKPIAPNLFYEQFRF